MLHGLPEKLIESQLNETLLIGNHSVGRTDIPHGKSPTYQCRRIVEHVIRKVVGVGAALQLLPQLDVDFPMLVHIIALISIPLAKEGLYAVIHALQGEGEEGRIFHAYWRCRPSKTTS